MTGLFLGHLAGDYLLQNEWMALTKSKNTLNGWMAALVHCILYTAAICLFMWNFDPIWIVVVFLSHFPIDKFSLTDKYLRYIKGRSLKEYVKKDDEEEFDGKYHWKTLINRYDVLESGFAAVVYTITDNAMHLILMWVAYQIIY